MPPTNTVTTACEHARRGGLEAALPRGEPVGRTPTFRAEAHRGAVGSTWVQALGADRSSTPARRGGKPIPGCRQGAWNPGRDQWAAVRLAMRTRGTKHAQNAAPTAKGRVRDDKVLIPIRVSSESGCGREISEEPNWQIARGTERDGARGEGSTLSVGKSSFWPPRGCGYSTSTVNSISTGVPRGRAMEPTAARA